MSADGKTTMSSEPMGGTFLPCAAAGLVFCLAWSYWPTIVEVNEFWSRNDDYSFGRLVPFVALLLIWRDRAKFAGLRPRASWSGLVVLLAAQTCRLGGAYFYLSSAERFSLALTVTGLVLFVGGWTVFRRAGWVLLFLFLMVPPPRRIHEMVALPLQRMSTTGAAFSLELMGYFVDREGNVLRIDETNAVAVTEACSGLRMLMAFIFVAAVLAFLLRRPVWQKVLLLVSSLPVAVLVNSARLILTSLFVVYSGSPKAEELFHDYAGLAMMPLAVVVLLLELRLFSHLTQPAGSGAAGPAIQASG